MKQLLFTLAVLLPGYSYAQRYSIEWYSMAGGGCASTGGIYVCEAFLSGLRGAGWRYFRNNRRLHDTGGYVFHRRGVCTMQRGYVATPWGVRTQSPGAVNHP